MSLGVNDAIGIGACRAPAHCSHYGFQAVVRIVLHRTRNKTNWCPKPKWIMPQPLNKLHRHLPKKLLICSAGLCRTSSRESHTYDVDASCASWHCTCMAQGALSNMPSAPKTSRYVPDPDQWRFWRQCIVQLGCARRSYLLGYDLYRQLRLWILPHQTWKLSESQPPTNGQHICPLLRQWRVRDSGLVVLVKLIECPVIAPLPHIPHNSSFIAFKGPMIHPSHLIILGNL